MAVLPWASRAVRVTLKAVPAVSLPPFSVAALKLAAAPGFTVMTAVVPLIDPSEPVMVGVSPALVRVKPPTVATPAVKVWLPLAGLVGAVLLGELVAVQDQLTVWLPT